MKLIVQKFGGSSVGSPERIRIVAGRVATAAREGNGLVVVVSAMGDATDNLIALSREVSDQPPPREMDMLLSTGEQISSSLLSMALNAIGCPAVSFTGGMAGFLTDDAYTKSRIRAVNPRRIREELNKGRVIVVAGFQGINSIGDITTLGRGGSDTTAVALAYVLKADLCEIFTDVDGVYTADPRVVPNARKIPRLSYDEMLEMAALGAKVLQSRSVEFAKRYNVPLHVRSSFNDREGSYVVKEIEDMEDVQIRAVTLNTEETIIAVRGVPDRPGIAAALFGRLAKENINVDLIIQSVAHGGRNDISFSVSRADRPRTLKACEAVRKEVDAQSVDFNDELATVSIVGVGMRSHPGVAASMFAALAEQNVSIEMVSTSEIRLSCVVKRDKAEEAARAVHDKFIDFLET